jgi:type IV pilus assembly protein PilW
VSLIELMIALLIGSLLMIGLVQVFGASREAYRLSEGLSRSQENGRFAMDYLQRDVRMAGHFGCVNDQSHLQRPGQLVSHFATAADPFPVDFTVSVQGYNATGTAPGNTVIIGSALPATWAPALPASISGLNPIPGSDIIALRYLSEEGVPVTAVSATGDRVDVSTARWATAMAGTGTPNPQLFGVADCSFADVFRATGVATAGAVTSVSINPAVGISSRYTAQPAGQTMLYRAESLVYYIGLGTGGEPSLFRARFDGVSYQPEELVEGIESLQMIYGQDRVPDLTTAPPSGFVDVHNVAQAGWNANQWRRVGLVQVGLLARSPDRAASAAPTDPDRFRRVLGVVMQPPATNDGRYRGVYEATIALRNRLYGN